MGQANSSDTTRTLRSVFFVPLPAGTVVLFIHGALLSMIFHILGCAFFISAVSGFVHGLYIKICKNGL